MPTRIWASVRPGMSRSSWATLRVRLVRRGVLLAGELRLGQASPVVSVDRVLRRHLGPEGRCLGPVTGCRPQFGPGHDGEEITRLDHARSSLCWPVPAGAGWCWLVLALACAGGASASAGL